MDPTHQHCILFYNPPEISFPFLEFFKEMGRWNMPLCTLPLNCTIHFVNIVHENCPFSCKRKKKRKKITGGGLKA